MLTPFRGLHSQRSIVLTLLMKILNMFNCFFLKIIYEYWTDGIAKAHEDDSSKNLRDSKISKIGNSEPKVEASNDGCTSCPKGLFSLLLGLYFLLDSF